MRIICVWVFLLSLLTNVPHLSAQSAAELERGFADGQAVIKLRDSVDSHGEKNFLERWGLTVHYRYPLIRALWVDFAKDRAADVLVARLRQQPEIEWAEVNAFGRRTVIPNDPSFANCYALNNTGQTIAGSAGVPDADMDCAEAWDIRHNASNVVLAIVDSGARLTHQDLSANIWINPGEIANNNIDDDGNGLVDDINGWDFAANNNAPVDSDGHGTNVTGTACARGNNGSGGSGVCWEAQAMIVKDGNAVPLVAASAAGIEYAAMMGAVVCNFSTGYGSGNFPVLQQAINVAQGLGMIICVAAGNSGSNLNVVSDAPATYTNDNLIVVAASDNADQPASFTNTGNVHVDVFAPGVDIYTTRRQNNAAYGFVDGTSFSAPLVTGCVALMRAHNPAATYQVVRSTLFNTVDTKPAFTGLVATNGRVNLNQALMSIGNTGAAPSPDPMTFQLAPSLLTDDIARMIASTANPSPVEYKFDLVSSTGGGGNSSPWQVSTTYVDIGLEANTQYTYTVKARNALSLAETAPSAPASVWTPAHPPLGVTLDNVTNGGFEIVAINAIGNPPTTEYSIEVSGQFVSASGTLTSARTWQTSANWAGLQVTGLLPETTYSVTSRARNGAGVETADSAPVQTTTSLLGACAAGFVGLNSGGPFDVLTLNGSSGGPQRLVQIPVGSPITTTIATPPTSGVPVNHALLGWFGVPQASFEFPLPLGIGTFCFIPCDVDPSLPAFDAWSTFGPGNCGFLASATPTPFSFFNPGYPFPLPDLTFQVILEESPGVLRVGNALVLRYQ